MGRPHPATRCSCAALVRCPQCALRLVVHSLATPTRTTMIATVRAPATQRGRTGGVRSTRCILKTKSSSSRITRRPMCCNGVPSPARSRWTGRRSAGWSVVNLFKSFWKIFCRTAKGPERRTVPQKRTMNMSSPMMSGRRSITRGDPMMRRTVCGASAHRHDPRACPRISLGHRRR